MKVFFPFGRNSNRFLDEIEYYFKGDFVYGEISDYNKTYSIVNIHWPEAIFKWEDPSEDALKYFEEALKKWQKYSKIVYTVHNENAHSRNFKNSKKLYELVIIYSDAFVHLGDFSKKMLVSNYPETKSKLHEIIPHPLYLKYKKSINILEARKKLNLPEHAKVVLVFGNIRDKKEYKLIFKAFNKLKVKNKILLISRMPYFLDWVPSWRLKTFFKWLKKFYFSLFSKYKFFYDFVKQDEIPLYFSAANVVFIPRIKQLNSGNVYLGLSYNKVVVGPNIGNIGEALSNKYHCLFNPKNINSVVEALEKGLSSNKNLDYTQQYKFHIPDNVTKRYESFFTRLLNE
ncbi:glycosyltransferase [Seonamhaeicola maritimus]|uniref:Glycosyltransferase family 4 protein n=1 Tax=Seonamhaeicola maritimus TaxID=2591822 RepID=A0A5C7GKJ5_9FLAO|nr:glycosyltransferase [Seonamhaeicola maritimus]TXG38868.1 glycosyltransferase family 4 protein [Seonamhaeicola maritimus]